jgi:excisionase family DNA binding protein
MREKGSSNARGNQVMLPDEVADFLRIHKATLYRLMKASKIPAFKVGSDWRFNRMEISRWMTETTHEVKK